MNRAVRSLRQRLFVVILLPLVLMATVLGYWRYTVALETAEQLFDRSLLAAALAISRDVSQSDGDALSPWTRNLIRDAAGDQVFYHMSGPAGAYVTGYAYPPLVPKRVEVLREEPVYFESLYRGEAVRVIGLTEHTSTEFLAGDTTVTVWQRMSARQQFARQLAFRAIALMGALLTTLAVVVWFGVQLGLRPLTDLQSAIASRSVDDLSTIKRAVPVEAQGIVSTLNLLFGRVASNLKGHQRFISDASHQLRNPAAAVLSTAESVRDASSDNEREQRVQNMVKAARSLSRVTEQLLSLERLQQSHWQNNSEDLDFAELIRDVCTDAAASVLVLGIEFEFDGPSQGLVVHAEPVLLAEAVKNLIDNAVQHGGDDLKQICVTVHSSQSEACVTVYDDGRGLQPSDQEKVFSRFGQLEPSAGSGLGLAISNTVAQQHGGVLRINTIDVGASISLCLPRLQTRGPMDDNNRDH